MANVEEMIAKYAAELAEALSNDLYKACKILTKIFKGVTTGDAINLLDELEASGMDCSLLKDCFTLVDSMILKGTRAGSVDATMRIGNIMETLHYDNGLPLSGYNYPEDNPTQWNDYFEHYDRDQDFWGFYWDEEIYNFTTDGKGIFMRVNVSLSDLRACLTKMYDGASWDHDFKSQW
jgi:hypothetical protein